MNTHKDTVERVALQMYKKSEWSDTTEIKLTSLYLIFLLYISNYRNNYVTG